MAVLTAFTKLTVAPSILYFFFFGTQMPGQDEVDFYDFLDEDG